MINSNKAIDNKKDYQSYFRSEFPLLKRKKNNKNIVYFDNAATGAKLKSSIKAVLNYYNFKGANIRRGPNFLAEEATLAFENARLEVAEFIGASAQEIIFTSGATASFNLLSLALAEKYLKKGDIIAISRAEHHANIIPWLLLKKKKGIILKYIDLDKNGDLDLNSLAKIFQEKRLKILSLTQASNVLGRFYDLEKILKKAKELNALTIVDASQSVVHKKIEVKKLDADFLIFSGHKLYAPSGVGVLYGKEERLADLDIFFGGGGIVNDVKEQSFSTVEAPFKFEAGTPNIEGVIGLGAALKYLKKISWEFIEEREKVLSAYVLKCLKKEPSLKLLGGVRSKNRLPLFSFSLKNFHPHDTSDLLGEEGIITRAGHHCAKSLHDYLEINSSLRISLAFYNSKEEVDRFFKAIKRVKKVLT